MKNKSNFVNFKRCNLKEFHNFANEINIFFLRRIYFIRSLSIIKRAKPTLSSICEYIYCYLSVIIFSCFNI
ncbi:hypothetical protein BpHYR1_022144 [Brachionus plicatilis]|uniref:Uncharacterized protein n=1 Tax=Brachionus plicatilis TaxID=10195 RepID=A0A3M7P7F9_BRAPC|nr:hypothetical protein BpHYR1_022144 [Brachionus plicatilis]